MGAGMSIDGGNVAVDADIATPDPAPVAAGRWARVKKLFAPRLLMATGLVLLCAVIIGAIAQVTVRPDIQTAKDTPLEEELQIIRNYIRAGAQDHLLVITALCNKSPRCDVGRLGESKDFAAYLSWQILEANRTSMINAVPPSSAPSGDTAPYNYTGIDYGLAALSFSVLNARLDVINKNAADYLSLEVFQWAAAWLGFLTTLAIAIRGHFTGLTKSFDILALVLSSLVTLVTSLSAFYSPQDSYAASTRELTGLRSLHTQLVLAAHTGTDENGQTVDEKMLAEWFKTYNDLTGSATTGSSSAQDATTSKPKS
jgi:hypothetical protein